MTRIDTIAVIVAITLVNLALVVGSSILAVGGDGSAEGVYWVLGVGGAWMIAFAVRAVLLSGKGEHRAAISFASSFAVQVNGGPKPNLSAPYVER